MRFGEGLAAGAGSVVAVGTFGVIAQNLPWTGQFNPSSVAAGSPAFTLAVNGEAFASGAVVYWDAEALSDHLCK
jgi:hypothetical protein